jgi:hypothetical protein
MTSEAQIAANQANARHSTGPKTEAGKAASSRNRLSHGLAGSFLVLKHENQAEYDSLLQSLQTEYQPSTITEQLLVGSIAQHQWLARRAVNLQESCFDSESGICDLPEKLALYLRYQTTHERAFHKCLNDLIKLQSARLKGAIGFESFTHIIRQERASAAEQRRQSAERRKAELHEIRLAYAKARLARPSPSSSLGHTAEPVAPALVTFPNFAAPSPAASTPPL